MFRLLSLILLLLNLNFAEAETLDKIVAVVNDQVITQSQLDALVDQMHKQIAQANIPSPGEYQLRTDALNQLINQSLQLQLAERAKVSVTNAELNNAINSIAQQNHLSVAELKDKVSTESGLTYAQFEEQVKQQILITKFQQMALGSKVDITDAQVNKAVLEAQAQQQGSAEYDISDILIPLPESPSTTQLREAETRATEIIKQLKAGQGVAELTTVVEENPSSPNEEKPGFFARLFKSDAELQREADAKKGTSSEQISAQDLGLRKKSDLPEVFAAQLGKLKTNGVAGPIRTANGLHVLRLNQIKSPPGLSVDRSQIRNQLYQQAIMKELPQWLEEVRKTAYIKIND